MGESVHESIKVTKYTKFHINWIIWIKKIRKSVMETLSNSRKCEEQEKFGSPDNVVSVEVKCMNVNTNQSIWRKSHLFMILWYDVYIVLTWIVSVHVSIWMWR